MPRRFQNGDGAKIDTANLIRRLRKTIQLAMILVLITPVLAYGMDRMHATGRAGSSGNTAAANDGTVSPAGGGVTSAGTGANGNAVGGNAVNAGGSGSGSQTGISGIGRQQLLQELNGIAAGAGGKFGISVVELDTGETFGVNQDEWFQAASTIKVPILEYLYQQIEQGNVSKDDVMTYTPEDYEDGTGSIQYTDYGTQWTVGELAEKMMKQSDNVAKNMFFRLLGVDEVDSFIKDQGSVFDVYNNETTPQSMANLLTLLYQDRIASPGLTGEMFDLMTNTDFEDRLPRYLNGVRIAHKIGSYGSSVSDVGIVFLADKPFVICVYSDDNVDPDQAPATIGTIALDVYNYEVSRPPAA